MLFDYGALASAARGFPVDATRNVERDESDAYVCEGEETHGKA